MWKSLVNKLFCAHNWETHNKRDKDIVYSGDRIVTVETTEILKCTKCGKIKKLTY